MMLSIEFLRIRQALYGLASGANDYFAKPFSKDELLARIKTHLNLLKINLAASEFVPHEFQRYLQKESIVDVRLGDHTQMEVTIFVSDIRAFTTIPEKMTPAENIDFINQYFGIASPLIREHNGFIDRYTGDAEETIELKLKTKMDFEQGLVQYFDKEFAEAVVCFKNVLKANADDKTASLYLESATQYVVHGVPEDWEGVEMVDWYSPFPGHSKS